jgi:hypothetical protein
MLAHRTTTRAAARIRPRPVPQSTRSFVKVIQQGTEAWRLTLGHTPVKLQPGLRMHIPLVHTVLQIDMREQSVCLSMFRIVPENSYTNILLG